MWIHCFCHSVNVVQGARGAYAVATSVNVATVLVTVVDPVYIVEMVVVEMGTSLVSVLCGFSMAYHTIYLPPLHETY